MDNAGEMLGLAARGAAGFCWEQGQSIHSTTGGGRTYGHRWVHVEIIY